MNFIKESIIMVSSASMFTISTALGGLTSEGRYFYRDVIVFLLSAMILSLAVWSSLHKDKFNSILWAILLTFLTYTHPYESKFAFTYEILYDIRSESKNIIDFFRKVRYKSFDIISNPNSSYNRIIQEEKKFRFEARRSKKIAKIKKEQERLQNLLDEVNSETFDN